MFTKIAVIMAVTLEPYEGSASNREMKFIRAVDSFLANNYPEKYLVIVSDGCQKSYDVYKKHFISQKNIEFVKILKQPLFSGQVRQKGIDIANKKFKPDYYCILDSDDFLLNTHLSNIVSQFEDNDFVYFNDFWNKNGILYQPHHVEIQFGSIGNSCIAWRNKKVFSYKNCNGWGHDFKFISEVLIPNSKKYCKIHNAGYVICHIKGMFDN